MNEEISKFIEKRKKEIEKKKHDKQVEDLINLGVGQRIYKSHDGTPVTDEWPWFDKKLDRAFKCDIGDFTDEEYEAAMKMAPWNQNGEDTNDGINSGKNILIALYLAWLGMHIVFLFFGSKGNWSPGLENFFDINSYVWPFQKSVFTTGLGIYDISEFVVYTVLPLLIYRILKLIKPLLWY